MNGGFPVRNPTEAILARIIAEHGILRGIRVQDTGDFFVWPAALSWHVPMADRLEGEGRIPVGARLERLVIERVEDAWWLYRDEP